MQIQTDIGVFDIELTWLESDVIELNIVETRDCAIHYHAARYISPAELSRLAEYINRTLCL
jgi:hypothetical protein